MTFRLQIKALLLLLFIAFTANLRAEDYVARVFTDTDGKTLPYRLLIPEGYDKEKDTKYPVLLFFHGAGERGTDNSAQLRWVLKNFVKPEIRSKFPCFVIAAQCPNNQQWVDMPWGWPQEKRPEKQSQSMQLAFKTLDAVSTEFNVDPDRIYVAGMSMGGYATWDCITRFPNRFAAAVPMCGGGEGKTVTTDVAKVPVWAFHAADDPAIPVICTRLMVKAMTDAGGHPHYTEYDTKLKLGHNCWEKAFSEPDLLPWMFAQRRGQPDPQPPTPPADSASSDSTNSPSGTAAPSTDSTNSPSGTATPSSDSTNHP